MITSYSLRSHLPKYRFILFTGIIAFILAYFIDQYYILGKGWWFLLELVES